MPYLDLPFTDTDSLCIIIRNYLIYQTLINRMYYMILAFQNSVHYADIPAALKNDVISTTLIWWYNIRTRIYWWVAKKEIVENTWHTCVFTILTSRTKYVNYTVTLICQSQIKLVYNHNMEFCPLQNMILLTMIVDN